MKRSRIVDGALIVVLILVLLFLATQIFDGVQQVTNPSASTLTPEGTVSKFIILENVSKTVLFIGLTIFTLLSLVGMAMLLVLTFRFLNQEVVTAKTDKPQPVNPLDYNTYGHVAGFLLVVGLMVLSWVVLVGDALGSLLPAAASEESDGIDFLFKVEFFIIGFFFALVIGLFIHFLAYYRARPGDMSDGKYVEGNVKLEIAWTLIPAVILFVLGIGAFVTLTEIDDVKANAVPVRVTGQQWNWAFEYSGELIPATLQDPEEPIESFTSPELVLMVGQPYVFQMTSVDVIHAFWIPEMRIKRDVVPGVVTEVRITPTKAGEYQMICSELCGTSHWEMIATVKVLDENEYNAWLEGVVAALGNPVLAGELQYGSNCATCHSIDGSSGIGPTWLNLYGRNREFEGGGEAEANEEYLHNSIVNPNSQIVEGFQSGLMPTDFGARLSEIEIEQLITFIKSQSAAGCEELEGDPEIDLSEVPWCSAQ